jgi:ribose transport system permease protein
VSAADPDTAQRAPETAADALTGESPARPLSRRRGLVPVIGRYGTLIFFVALFAFFSLYTESFFDGGNFVDILDNAAHLGIIAAGLTMTLVMLDFDLSIGYTATLANMYAAGVAVSTGSTLLGFGAGLLAGVVVGVLNGLIVTSFNISAFIVTLGAGFIIQGVIFGYRSGAQISFGLPDDFSNLGLGTFALSYQTWIMLATMLVLWVVLQQTPVGRRMYAVGGNPTAARLSGIHIARLRVTAFVISGTAAALAGVLLASNNSGGNPTVGVGYLLDAFAACFIGAATVRNGEFHIGGTLLGVLLLGMLDNGLVLAGVSGGDWPYIVKGIILIGALALTGVLRRSAAR